MVARRRARGRIAKRRGDGLKPQARVARRSARLKKAANERGWLGMPYLSSQSRGAPQRLGFSLSKWRLVLRSLLKNRYRTTYQCYSFSETSRHGAFSAAYGASNRHHGGECDLGEGRHRLVGSTSMRSFSVVPLLPRSLSLHDVAVAREVLFGTRLMSLRSPRRVMIRRFDDRIWV